VARSIILGATSQDCGSSLSAISMLVIYPMSTRLISAIATAVPAAAKESIEREARRLLDGNPENNEWQAPCNGIRVPLRHDDFH
jgi:hypothetical protein